MHASESNANTWMTRRQVLNNHAPWHRRRPRRVPLSILAPTPYCLTTRFTKQALQTTDNPLVLSMYRAWPKKGTTTIRRRTRQSRLHAKAQPSARVTLLLFGVRRPVQQSSRMCVQYTSSRLNNITLLSSQVFPLYHFVLF